MNYTFVDCLTAKAASSPILHFKLTVRCSFDFPLATKHSRDSVMCIQSYEQAYIGMSSLSQTRSVGPVLVYMYTIRKTEWPHGCNTYATIFSYQ